MSAITWQEHPRSFRASTALISADVWPMVDHSGRTLWQWTVRRDDTGVYLNKGAELTEDAAKAKAEAVLEVSR